MSRRTELATGGFAWLVAAEALSFLVFAVLHLGVRIPAGLATIGTDRIPGAVVPEALCGAALAVSAYGLLAHRRWALRATVLAQAFSLVAVIIGIAAISTGLGPHSPVNDAYHRVMAPLLALTLVWLATPPGRTLLHRSA
jgi:hypothetical protein